MLTPQQRAGLPSGAGRPGSLCEGGLSSGAFHPPHRQQSGPSTVPVFQGGQAHLPGSVNSSALSFLLGQSTQHPLPLGPGLFGNNGGNIKQGLKTGSESLDSQTGSLEGAGRREGPQEAGATWGAWRGWGEASRMFSVLPHNSCPAVLSGFLRPRPDQLS